MMRKTYATRVAAFLVLAFILVACSGPTAVVQPTQDLDVVRTQAAQTVVAKITIEAALNVTPTAEATAVPQVITATPAPSDTPAPTATVEMMEPTATPLVIATAAPHVIYPTFTVRAGPDQAKLVSQTPTDGTAFNPSNSFDAVWTMKNIGTSTWNDHYYFRFGKKGTNLALTDRYYIHGTVKPGESTQLIADMVAPSGEGRYVSYWELCNDNGAIFYNFYAVIDVKAP